MLMCFGHLVVHAEPSQSMPASGPHACSSATRTLPFIHGQDELDHDDSPIMNQVSGRAEEPVCRPRVLGRFVKASEAARVMAESAADQQAVAAVCMEDIASARTFQGAGVPAARLSVITASLEPVLAD